MQFKKPFKIEWSERAEAELSKLPKDIASRIVNKVDSIKLDPFHFLKHYEGEDVYKLRIGDYRALIDVDFSDKILKIQIIGHRKNIYKRLTQHTFF